MTSRRAIPTYEQRVSRALQFRPGHAGGRVDSAQPVRRLGGTLRGPAVGAAGAAPTAQYIEIPWAGTSQNGTTTVGNRHRFSVAGQVTGVHFYVSPVPYGNGNGYEVYLFSNAGTMLASKDADGLAQGAWSTVLFNTPVSVAAATTYVAAVWTPSGARMYTNTDDVEAGVTSGDVRLLADEEDGLSAVRAFARDTFPTSGIGYLALISAVFQR